MSNAIGTLAHQHLGEFQRPAHGPPSRSSSPRRSRRIHDEIIKLLILPAGEGLKLASFSPTENFTTYMRVALFTGIALAMPVLLYEIYAYIDPALHQHERRFAITLGPFILLLFIAGMSFCYFLVLPSALKFLLDRKARIVDGASRRSRP